MARMLLHGLVPFILLPFIGCAVGTPAPEPTPMVPITEGLVFLYGPDEPCVGNDDDSVLDPCSNGTLLKQSEQTAPAVYVQLTPFKIDAHEVTNIQYDFCEAMGKCPKHNIINAISTLQQDYHGNVDFDNHPVVQVTYAQAEAYCAFVGKRLPTEVEWERVARGNPSQGDNRFYPAEQLDKQIKTCIDLDLPTKFCGSTDLERSPTASELESGGDSNDYVIERTGSGGEHRIYHMFGNAAEWTSSFFDPSVEPTCGTEPPCTQCADCSDQPCKDVCVDCPTCPISEAGCFYLCRDEPALTIGCQPPPNSEASPLSPSSVVSSTSIKRVVRGGSVFDGTNTVCRFRSSGRKRAAAEAVAPDRHLAYVGFRCAQDL